jgi:N-acetylglucosaminyl-diphospho-decaprenol L-rhamnosyltransferase
VLATILRIVDGYSAETLGMHVAIIIVGFRNKNDILSCLEALDHSTHTDFEVVICENGGRAAFAELAAALPASLTNGQLVRALEAPRNLGYAGGVNSCLMETPAAEAWWILNPDTKPLPEALEVLVDRLRVGNCEAAGCTVHLASGQIQSYGGRWSPWLARGVSMGRGDPLGQPIDRASIERTQNYLNGASMLVGRAFLGAVGPMREDYFLYCEEVEWCLRAAAMGMKLGYASDAIVVHDQGTTTGAGKGFARLARMPIYLNERNRMLLTYDCFPAKLPIAAPLALLLLFVRAARSGGWRQFGYGFSGWLAGLLNRRSLPAWLKADLQ